MTPKLPPLLVRHIQQKRCVVFVGAGLSAGAGLPTWARLLSNGIHELVGALPEGELHQAELDELVKKGKLLEVADFCKEKLGAAYHQFLSEQVRGDQAKELPTTHDVLMRLPFSAWVTTNYDKLLERAYSQVKGGGFPKTLTHKDTEALGRLLFDGGPFILKAHGDIDRPETVVLTSRDYSDIIHANPAFNEIFSGLLLTKALLFVGYSLSDPDFRLLLDRQLTHFKGFVPERYALMTGVGPVERDVLWRTARIQVISYENASGNHAEVLEFLQTLEAQLAPKPALEAMPPPQSTPAPAAAPQIKQAVPYNVSAGSGSGIPSWVMQDDEPAAPAPALMSRPSAQARQASGTLPLTSHQLFIEEVQGRLQLRLIRGDVEPVLEGIAPTSLSDKDSRALLRDLFLGPTSEGGFYTQRVRRFLEVHLPPQVLNALEEQGDSSQAPLVLHIAPGLEWFPWEILLLQGEPVCLKRKLVRAPVGVPAQVRGVPLLRLKPRVLLIEGRGDGSGSGGREIERLAALYPVSGFDLVRLQGGDATFGRVMEELRAEQDDALPDLVHYTGRLDLVGHELVLPLPGTTALSVGDLRSVLSHGRLPFLVMNAPSSALGLSMAASYGGVMGMAAQQGVGAFVGTLNQPDASAGSDFMGALHRALITGLPIADAVLLARKEVHAKFPKSTAALQYVLSGDGDLQLVNSQRE